MSEHINSAENIKVISIAFYSERFDPKFIFVAGDATAAPTAAEIVIYEDIMKPYLTAALIFQDDEDFNKLKYNRKNINKYCWSAITKRHKR